MKSKGFTLIELLIA
ncbi:MAG: prepilin-type N-terminal cleavage/methylation domain-containing protein, partial [Pararheinheimera sp.]|nr:prepilin-type N-terminal cleavage/methylation domain-containing protein [Rheinheimera sp.]